MIQYDNGSAFTLIFNLRGSVLPQCLPVGILTFLMGLALAILREMDEDKEWYFSKDPKYIDDPYPVQVFSTVLCFVLIMRTNMALDRWMGGISDVQLMLSKWGDAFAALNSFFSGKKGTTEQMQEILMFRIRVAHWFSLMSCLCFATLRTKNKHGALTLAEVPIKELFAVIDRPEDTNVKSFVANRIRARRPSTSSQGSMGSLGSTSFMARMTTSHPEVIRGLDLLVLATPSAEEVALLEHCYDKPNVIALWIIQGVIIMVRKKLLDIPPPIVSRVFQELSNGILGFNQAHKVAMVPFPFPFAQLMSVLLFLVYLVMPFYIDLFTRNTYVTPIISFFLPMVYCALNKIAVELEEPFGCEANHVDIEVRHEDFLWLLVDVLRAPKACPTDTNYELEKDIIYGVLKDCPIIPPGMEAYVDDEEQITQTHSYIDQEASDNEDEDGGTGITRASTRSSQRKSGKDTAGSIADEHTFPASASKLAA